MDNVAYQSTKVVLSQIKQLGLNFSMVFTNNWTETTKIMSNPNKVVVMYGWEPDPFFHTARHKNCITTI